MPVYKMLHLQGPWKVGLMNRIFPSTFSSPAIGRLGIMVSLGNIEMTYGSFDITVTSIETVDDLFDAIQTTLEKKATEHGLNLSDNISIRFFDDSDQNLSWKYPGFQRVLGAETGSTQTTVASQWTIMTVTYRDNFVFILQQSIVRLNPARQDTISVETSLKEQILNLYVKTNIVEPHPVGDTQANLLRIVPVKDNEGRIVSEEFAAPLYFRLSRSNFNTVSILITDDTGNEVPFEDATVQLTLSFDRTLSH